MKTKTKKIGKAKSVVAELEGDGFLLLTEEADSFALYADETKALLRFLTKQLKKKD